MPGSRADLLDGLTTRPSFGGIYKRRIRSTSPVLVPPSPAVPVIVEITGDRSMHGICPTSPVRVAFRVAFATVGPVGAPHRCESVSSTRGLGTHTWPAPAPLELDAAGWGYFTVLPRWFEPCNVATGYDRTLNEAVETRVQARVVSPGFPVASNRPLRGMCYMYL